MNNIQKSISQEIAQEETFKFSEIQNEDPNAVFVEFNPDKALEILNNFDKLTEAEKTSYTRNLAELISGMGEKGLKALPNLFNQYLKEKQHIKKLLLQQITPLVNLIQSDLKNNYDFKYKLLIDSFVPLLSQLLQTANIHLKESCGQELALLSQIFNDDDRGKYILTVVLGMAHDDLQEENRIVAVQLLSKMANSFGKDLCEQFVGLEFLSLGEDPQIKVRKEAVMHLPIISKVVSISFVRQKLIPFYMRVSQDNVWIVRKACVDVLDDMFQLCDQDNQQQQLIELMLGFLKDSTKWVKIAAYKQLGKVIVQLKDKKKYEKLLEFYLQMAQPEVAKLGNGSEMMENCAYNFPAVLWATYNESNWPTFIKLFRYMLQHGDNKVRQPLICSLHEIAKLIGPTNAEIHLFPVFDKVFKENTELKYGAIKHLSEFLQIFTDEKRDNLVDILLNLQKEHPNQWRVRELIADQIGNLAQVYRAETLFKIITPISFKLCQDSVSLVRNKASFQIKNILLRFDHYLLNLKSEIEKEEIQFYKNCLVQNILGFSLCGRYTQRQTFILICQGMIKDWTFFKTHFLEAFYRLAKDKVVNVKITLVQTLYTIYQQDPIGFHQELRDLISVIDIQNIQSNEILTLIPLFTPLNNMELEQFKDENKLIQNDHFQNNHLMDVESTQISNNIQVQSTQISNNIEFQQQQNQNQIEFEQQQQLKLNNIDIEQQQISNNIEVEQQQISNNIKAEQQRLNNNIEIEKQQISNNIEVEQQQISNNIEVEQQQISNNIEIEQQQISNNIEIEQQQISNNIEVEHYNKQVDDEQQHKEITEQNKDNQQFNN